MTDLNRTEAKRLAMTKALSEYAGRMAEMHKWTHNLFLDIRNIDADLAKTGAVLTTYEREIMREVYKFVQNLGEPVILIKDDLVGDLKKLCKRTEFIVARLEKLA